MRPEIISGTVRAVLETDEDRLLGAMRAPGLAKVKLPHLLTEVGTNHLMRTLIEISENRESLYYPKAMEFLGRYAIAAELLKEEARKKDEEDEA